MTEQKHPDLFKDPKANEPWIPMSNLVDIKYIGKLGEEICETGSAIFRCIIQGIDEKHPETGRINKEWLEDEIADVEANLALVKSHFGLDTKRMGYRIRKKKSYLLSMHNAIPVVLKKEEICIQKRPLLSKFLNRYLPFLTGFLSIILLILIGTGI